MRQRRRPRGTKTWVQIGTDAEYRKALEELEELQQVPLGTERTEGLQDLVEAILEYEARQGRVDGNGRMH